MSRFQLNPTRTTLLILLAVLVLFVPTDLGAQCNVARNSYLQACGGTGTKTALTSGYVLYQGGSGAFTGKSNLSFNAATNTLSVTNLTVTGTVNVTGSTVLGTANQVTVTCAAGACTFSVRPH